MVLKAKDYNQPRGAKTVLYGRGNKPSKLKIQEQSEGNIIKNLRNLFKLKKGNKSIKDRIIRYIKTLFKQQKEYYYKPVRIGNFWKNNYIEYEISGGRNKNLSVKEYFKEIKPYLRDIIINLQKSNSWKIQAFSLSTSHILVNILHPKS